MGRTSYLRYERSETRETQALKMCRNVGDFDNTRVEKERGNL